MRLFNVRNAIGGLVVGGASVALALVGPGMASADPDMASAASLLNSPLVNSTCSFGQIDRALHADRPDLAAKLDANPQRKAMMQQLMDQPVPQRKESIQRYLNEHPDEMSRARQYQSANPEQVRQRQAYEAHLANICHNY